MKNRSLKVLAMMLVLMVAMSSVAFAVKLTPSQGFKLPTVQYRATPEPEATEVPEATAEPEVTAVPEKPAATEEPAAEATEEIAVELRQIVVVLTEGETELALHAAADAASEVVALIPAGEILYVADIAAEWSYAIYGEFEGYVLTSKIALYNDQNTTPEEEEIIRTIKVSSNIDGQSVVYAGTEIILTAALTGFEDDEYTVQWQYSPDGGTSIYDVEGGNELQHAFIINDENADWLWKICITILEPVVEEAVEAEPAQ